MISIDHSVLPNSSDSELKNDIGQLMLYLSSYYFEAECFVCFVCLISCLTSMVNG